MSQAANRNRMKLADLKKAVEDAGCTLEICGSRYRTYEVVAPAGYSFDGLHSLVSEVTPFYDSKERDEILSDLVQRVRAGLTRCDDDCECIGVDR